MFLGVTKTRLRPEISSPVKDNREDEDEEHTQSMIFARRQSGGGEERCTPGLSVLWLIPLTIHIQGTYGDLRYN